MTRTHIALLCVLECTKACCGESITLTKIFLDLLCPPWCYLKVTFVTPWKLNDVISTSAFKTFVTNTVCVYYEPKHKEQEQLSVTVRKGFKFVSLDTAVSKQRFVQAEHQTKDHPLVFVFLSLSFNWISQKVQMNLRGLSSRLHLHTCFSPCSCKAD